MDDFNDLMFQINEIHPERQENESIPTNDSGLPASISGVGVDADNPEANEQYIQENQQPQLIIQGGDFANELQQSEQGQDSDLATSISQTRSTEFVPEILYERADTQSQSDSQEADTRPMFHLNADFFDLRMNFVNAARGYAEPSDAEIEKNCLNGLSVDLDNHNAIKNIIKSDHADLFNITSFEVAIGKNDTNGVKALLELGARPAPKHPFHSMLYSLIKNPINDEVNLDMIELFLEYGAVDVNELFPTGFKPLHLAVKYFYDSLNLVKLLITHGADVKEKCSFNRSATDLCIDKRTKCFLEDFEKLLDEEVKIENSSSTENEKKEKLDVLKQKKQIMLKITENLIPINTRLEYIEKSKQEQSKGEQSEGQQNEEIHKENYSETFSGLKGFFNESQSNGEQNKGEQSEGKQSEGEHSEGQQHEEIHKENYSKTFSGLKGFFNKSQNN